MNFKKKKSLEESYERIINVGFCLIPYEDLSGIIGPNPMVFGTTKDERIFNFEGVDALFKSQFEQMDSMEPSLDRKRLATQISADENNAFIVEEITLSLSSREEVTTIFMRASCVMEYMDHRWKLTHWHTSTPVDTENDPWHMEEWKREKEKLQKLVDQQTADLQLKNRELEIEAAIERVRAIAMGMTKPDDMLDVCRVISDQLQQLGVNHIRNVQTAIIDEKIGRYLCYQYFSAYDQTIMEETEYHKSPVEDEMVKNMLASRDGHFIGTLAGKELDEFRSHRKAENQFPDPLLDEASELNYCFLSIGEGGLGLSLYQALNEDVMSLFDRFHNVFSLAYRRFRDIEKAEAQAREAQIETALERVRSRTMAMQHSDELQDTALLLFQQVQKLGIPPFACGFNIWDNDKMEATTWMGSVKGLQPHFKTDSTKDIYQLIYDAAQKGEQLYVIDQSGKDLEEHYTYLATIPTFRDVILPDFQQKGISLPTYQIIHCAFFSQGYLMFITYEPVKTAYDIFVRFARVFDQTYTRFLDLQKAEEQAREAQIELSLERIRAQATAMQESSDLLDIVVTMRNEFVKLGQEAHYFWHMRWLPEKYEKAMTSGDGTRIGMVMTLPRHIHGDIEPVADWEKSDEPTYVLAMDVDTAVDYVDKMISLGDFEQVDPQAPSLDDVRHIGGLTFIMARTTHGEIGYSLPGVVPNPPEDAIETLVRFAGVFDLAYKRFEDLKAAERQHREAQIELALERIRARTMAMQKSEELADASEVLDQQVRALGIETWGCAFHIYADNDEGDFEWFSGSKGLLPFYKTPREEFFLKFYEKGQQGEKFHVEEFKGEDCKAHYNFLKTIPVAGDALTALEESGIPLPTYQIDHIAFFNHGYVLFITYKPVPEAHDIFQRFAKVFEQTYTRFLDLQKAEKQARKAEIEASLERVRAKAMAMHSSEDIESATAVVFNELSRLGIDMERCGITLLNETPIGEIWSTPLSQESKEVVNVVTGYLDFGIHPILQQSYKDWRVKKDFSAYKLVGDEVRNYYAKLEEQPEYKFPKVANYPEQQILNTFYFKEGGIFAFTVDELSAESKDIIQKFTKVFAQTYTRFRDIQKAEFQAREAKIETALEKVRSRTMGMQSSDELPEVANMLFLEVQALGIPAWSSGFNILAEDNKSAAAWMSSEGTLQKPFTLRLWGEASFEEMGAFARGNDIFMVQELGGEALLEHYNHMKSFPDLKPVFEDIEAEGLSLPTYQINHLCKFAHGFLLFITYEPVPEAHNIFKRFTRVFDQTYTRFLDLKKAEKQAREAQIENALEKVRSRSLAMQHPDELTEVVQLLREEMGALGVEELETSSIYIHDESSGLTECWFTIKNTDDPGKAITDQMTIDLQDTWVGRQMHEFYHSPAKRISILMQGENREEWIRYCEEKSDLFGTNEFYGETIPERTYHLYKFSNGFLGAASPGSISEESWDLLKRATVVFSFAYTRFSDLQIAEASARASIRQASLDRVRADIASMRSAEDLSRVTPLIWNELKTLDIPFIRCGVFIIHEEEEQVEVYLSKPDGTSLAVMHLSFGSSDLVNETVDAWRNSSVHTQHWTQEEFLNWGGSMMKQGQIPDLKTYQGDEEAPESLHLHFIPFNQGMLYVGATETLIDEEIDLSASLAEAFAIAYARYEDFVKLEKAKKAIEEALTELKATQSQLIQQEKLASLGQLTAGIAHEIKNPLNFVNNFSELSVELIEEAREELQSEKVKVKSKRATDEPPGDVSHIDKTFAILIEIETNLKTIHKHGTRADSIVKSMLEHSRAGDGTMEPTNLNGLVKEFVNLSFHGMRAGKNPIDVDMEFELDESISEVPLIAEDFSRVIVNLCNNAFDAMRKLGAERSAHGKEYEPKLTIRSKKTDDAIALEIEDNGQGIPEEKKDKILQPFFTTKKGTEGTGLGLSITNDIIKAHGGELSFNSSFGTGSTFIITLKP